MMRGPILSLMLLRLIIIVISRDLVLCCWCDQYLGHGPTQTMWAMFGPLAFQWYQHIYQH